MALASGAWGCPATAFSAPTRLQWFRKLPGWVATERARQQEERHNGQNGGAAAPPTAAGPLSGHTDVATAGAAAGAAAALNET